MCFGVEYPLTMGHVFPRPRNGVSPVLETDAQRLRRLRQQFQDASQFIARRYDIESDKDYALRAGHLPRHVCELTKTIDSHIDGISEIMRENWTAGNPIPQIPHRDKLIVSRMNTNDELVSIFVTVTHVLDLRTQLLKFIKDNDKMLGDDGKTYASYLNDL
jgi:hypothetical protein